MRLLPLLFALIFLSPLHAAFDLSPTPPAPEKKPKDVSVHGDRREDNYFWLREKEDPAVMAYLRAENGYTDEVMAGTKPLQAKLYQEMIGRIQESDISVPVKDGAYTYYSRTEEGKQYPLYCRRLVLPKDAPEEILLDVNALAVGEKFMSIGHFEVSDDGLLLAYSVDRNGHRDYEVQVKDLRTGKLVDQTIGVVSFLEWAADNETLVFTEEETETKRSYRVSRYHLPTAERSVLFEEKDDQYDVDIAKSRDRELLFLTSASKTTTEVRTVDTRHPTRAPRLIQPREDDVEYYVDHRDGIFYIVTNWQAKNFQIMTAPVTLPGRENWTTFLPHRESVKVEGIDLFRAFAVISEREAGLPHLAVRDFTTGRSHRIPMPEPVFDVHLDENPEYGTLTLRYRYASYVTPASVYEYDVTTGRSTLLKETPVLGGYDKSEYASERLFAQAGDGTKIPISLVYRKSLREGGPQPLLLYGYGSYGYALDASFSSRRLSLLDRGVIFAVAHVRGGGEMGEPWHDGGKMAMKMNTFTDFIACAEYLQKEGYTTSRQMIANGGSAGGLLMGAVVNLRPDLFAGIVADVPFVDVINTMLDASLPLTTAEYLEWGNPEIKEQYDWIRAYSPYDNISAATYPPMLFNVSLNDSAVPYWEGAKFVAKVREMKNGNAPIILKANLDAGHGGASGRYDSLRELAFDYAFMLTVLGIEN